MEWNLAKEQIFEVDVFVFLPMHIGFVDQNRRFPSQFDVLSVIAFDFSICDCCFDEQRFVHGEFIH
jgi:hypothetical protein